jgi:hypothetical protein
LTGSFFSYFFYSIIFLLESFGGSHDVIGTWTRIYVCCCMFGFMNLSHHDVTHVQLSTVALDLILNICSLFLWWHFWIMVQYLCNITLVQNSVYLTSLQWHSEWCEKTTYCKVCL